MATMIKNRKKVTLTIEQKAQALTVFDIGEPGRLACTSGTEENTAYVVHHNEHQATHCPCRSYCRCSHLVATDWYLEAKNRAIFHVLFNPDNIE